MDAFPEKLNRSIRTVLKETVTAGLLIHLPDVNIGGRMRKTSKLGVNFDMKKHKSTIVTAL